MFPDVAAAPPVLGSPQRPWQPPWQSRMVSHPCAQLAHDITVFLSFQSQARFQNYPLSSRTEVSIDGTPVSWSFSFPWLSLAVSRSKLMHNTRRREKMVSSLPEQAHVFPSHFSSSHHCPLQDYPAVEAPCIILSSSIHILKCQKNLGSNFNMMTN